jgi:hypothetical protein
MTMCPACGGISLDDVLTKTFDKALIVLVSRLSS